MKTRLGCLHAHYSNIAYIDGILNPDRIEAVHFVDPGLMHRIGSDACFSAAQAREHVHRQLAWMAAGELQAILITCTNYIAAMPDEQPGLPLPVVKIDEPFFADLCEQDAPALLLFTNPATVAGTMRRFRQYADRAACRSNVEVETIEGTFDLFMAGRAEEYAAVVSARLLDAVRSRRYRSISVGQLSMVDAARQVAEQTGTRIGHPLDPLQHHLAGVLRRVTDTR